MLDRRFEISLLTLRDPAPFRIKKFHDVTTSKLINAATLKLIKVSKEFHDRFTAIDPKFLSSTLIQRRA